LLTLTFYVITWSYFTVPQAPQHLRKEQHRTSSISILRNLPAPMLKISLLSGHNNRFGLVMCADGRLWLRI